MKLRISDSLSLPLEAVTEKIAFLGRTGSGKTYAAMKLAELMLSAGAQIIALDPVGAWHGLRIGGIWQVYIFGGIRGDFPLEPTGGKLMADLIIDKGISAVLDVSQFIRSEQVRFACDFIERFFHRKKAAPSAVHLFLEECQEFVPQNVAPNESHMLHHFERAWKLGRNFGIGGSLISQRPQEINKKALNQAGTLFVFNMTGPQERKAIAEWTRQAGIDEDIESVLPTLKTGNPHVWSPTFLQISRTIQIAQKVTADVSMTPKVGERTQEQTLTHIDVERLKTEMAATVERAKADDPKELRRQIVALKQQILSFKKDVPPAVQPVEVITADDRKLLHDLQNVITVVTSELHHVNQHHDSLESELLRSLRSAKYLNEAVQRISHPLLQVSNVYKDHGKLHNALYNDRQGVKIINVPMTPAAVSEGMDGPEQRILDAIAWMASIGISDPEQTAVAFLAGYKVTGGAYKNPRGRLSKRGLIEYLSGDRLKLTPAGAELANAMDTALTNEALQQAVRDRLPGPECKILDVLINTYPAALSNDECAQRAGYNSNGGAYKNPRGRLSTLGLIEYVSGGLRIRDILFPL